MSFCSDITPNCDTCLEVSVASCASYTFTTTNLTALTAYYVVLIDKFDVKYIKQFTTTVNKAIVIDFGDYDGKVFNQYQGKIEMYVSTSSTGATTQSVTIGGTSYNCILIDIT